MPGYWLTFRGLDALQEVKATGLFFPLAVGTNILTFTLYSLCRERWTWMGAAGLALGLAGLVWIGVSP